MKESHQKKQELCGKRDVLEVSIYKRDMQINEDEGFMSSLESTLPGVLDQMEILRIKNKIQNLRKQISAGVKRLDDLKIEKRSVEKEISILQNQSAKEEQAKELAHSLPYLPDRDIQVKEVETALGSAPAERPVIWVVHGDDDQCAQKFYERLRDRTLPQFLNLDEQTPVDGWELPWPKSIESIDELEAELEARFAREFLGPNKGTIEDADKELAARRGPTLLQCHLPLKKWDDFGEEMIRRFVRFWNARPRVGPRLIVCLIIEYRVSDRETKSEADQRQVWPAILAKWFGGLGGNKAADPVEEERQRKSQVLQFLDNYCSGDELENVHWNCLPELPSVDRDDAERWGREVARKELQGRVKASDLQDDIRKFYEKTQADKVPMGPLSEVLRNLLAIRLGTGEKAT